MIRKRDSMNKQPVMPNKSVYLKRVATIAILDVICICLAYVFALWVRYDFVFSSIPSQYRSNMVQTLPIWCVFSLAVFSAFKLYNSIWIFVSADELFRIVGAYCVLALCSFVQSWVFRIEMPLSYYPIGLFLSFCLTVAIRFSYRLMRQVRQNLARFSRNSGLENVMIIGAGEAGRALLTEFQNSAFLASRVVCMIDDNPVKFHKQLSGVPIVGGRDAIMDAVKQYQVSRIIYAIPSSSAQTRKEILGICSKTGCQVQALPGIYQLVNGEVSVSKLRKVDVQDLLGREPIRVRLDEILDYICGKTVLVTGGGGSIGSELCRQIARANPKKLIIFDIYENNAYDIQQELRRNCPELELVVLIGSVRDEKRLEKVLGTYKPDLLFHAAAHKHVPLMEDSPNESIKNNVFGTYNVAMAASKHGVKRMVLISSDKAVNPTNIMGASKRLCEMVIQMMDRRSETEFVAVRFGNVLGSNGSVVPLFKRQIEAGGPVTVTHPDMIRYFMTIPEAVSLVLQAGYYARGGEIFVLDMGEPVKIDDMARNLIRLSGFEPDVDIRVEYTGLRPGEKLFEELLMDEEGMQSTANHLIHIGKPIEMDDDQFLTQLSELEQAAHDEFCDMKSIVARIVPTYQPSEKAKT